MNFGILPKTLYTTSSPFSGEICVLQKGKERQLVVGGYVQSINWDFPKVKDRVWGKIVEQASFVLNSPVETGHAPSLKKEILILGLGAGTEVHLLSKQYPRSQITAVEIDPVIIQIAKNFFDVGKIPNLEIVEGDAFKFLEETKEIYDLIICDIYAAGEYPKEADSEEFLLNLAKHSKTAIFNRIFDSMSNPAAREFEHRLKNHFKTVSPVPARHQALNILYVCS